MGLPFELVFRGDATWRGYWAAQKLRIALRGSEQAPHAASLALLTEAIEGWPALQDTIAAFVRGLSPEHHVPLTPASIGGFAAKTCGFGEALAFDSLSVADVDGRERLLVTFYTGEPDGYASFEVALEQGAPVAIRAFAS